MLLSASAFLIFALTRYSSNNHRFVGISSSSARQQQEQEQPASAQPRQAPSPTPVPQNHRFIFVLAMGDSNTRGGPCGDLCFPALLPSTSVATRKNISIRVLNFGVPNTAISRTNIKHAYQRRLAYRQVFAPSDWAGVDKVLISFGTNDSRDKIFKSIHEFESAYAELLQKLRGTFLAHFQHYRGSQAWSTKQILILTPPPLVARDASGGEVVLTADSPSSMFTPAQRRYNTRPGRLLSIVQSLRQLASRGLNETHISEVVLVDVFQRLSMVIQERRIDVTSGSSSFDSAASDSTFLPPPLMEPDGIHLSQAGAAMVAELIAKHF